MPRMPTPRAPPPRPWHPDSKCLQYVYPDTERPGAYYVEVQCGQIKKALRVNPQVLFAICARLDPFRNDTELAALGRGAELLDRLPDHCPRRVKTAPGANIQLDWTDADGLSYEQLCGSRGQVSDLTFRYLWPLAQDDRELEGLPVDFVFLACVLGRLAIPGGQRVFGYAYVALTLKGVGEFIQKKYGRLPEDPAVAPEYRYTPSHTDPDGLYPSFVLLPRQHERRRSRSE